MSGEAPRNLDDDVRKPDSVLLRGLFAVLGGLFVALAVAGLFLPVVPTVPLLLVAAACFARSSRRIYRWLMEHQRYGPHIREWRHHRSIPYRAKRPALLLMAVSFGVSLYFLPNWPARVFMALLGVALGLWLWRLPSRDDPRHPGSTIENLPRSPG
ncbi:MAG: YbaN family protein [Steroidobacteraceae bacterium]|jgi:hypothetical protein|nr:YbaN family protein [Steroidobacteraceae bacterium]